ncbi:flavodoxin family protein [Sphingorhabdus lacus]|jgi:multimeric flavodoxin WrbA|uniref:Flavodoxin family protein n=1 Tax=Sphingorhabdus lacus TaxID=392610 RepID=A0A6I6L636_9SPHN|nr:NAD(P)H-dependent oxidoreductase [Sphingorhabdus lacus]QGY81269.1 flavodoxin family protein [Sphingorhabdus lacus]
MKELLIVWHSMTGGSRALAKAAAQGAEDEGAVKVSCVSAEQANPLDMLGAHGYLFVFPENLAAISGVMKAFFDRCYYPCLGRIEGRPYAMIICAGSDGSNAARQAERIATGWRLRKIAEPLIICTHAQTETAIMASKTIGEEGLEQARQTGAHLAAGMALGIF